MPLLELHLLLPESTMCETRLAFHCSDFEVHPFKFRVFVYVFVFFYICSLYDYVFLSI